MSGQAVSCEKCGSEMFSSVNYYKARPARKFLWFVRPAREEQLVITCAVCGCSKVFKPDAIKVTSLYTYNRITGRRTELL